MKNRSKVTNSIKKILLIPTIVLAFSVVLSVITCSILKIDVKTDNGLSIVFTAVFLIFLIYSLTSLSVEYYRSMENEEKGKKIILSIFATGIILGGVMLISQILTIIICSILKVNMKTDEGELMEFFIRSPVVILLFLIVRFLVYFEKSKEKNKN